MCDVKIVAKTVLTCKLQTNNICGCIPVAGMEVKSMSTTLINTFCTHYKLFSSLVQSIMSTNLTS